jgi:hypothetical protein
MRAAAIMLGWFAFCWAAPLLPNPEPRNAVHMHLASVIPLWGYGVIALVVFISYWLAGALAFLVRYRWAEHNAHLLSCGFWSFISCLFFVSGASHTGTGVYLVMAISSGTCSLVTYNRK